MKGVYSPRFSFGLIFPWLVLAFLAAYTYATFALVPFVGFDFNPTDGQVTIVYAPAASGGSLHAGDYILRIGSSSWAAARADTGQVLFPEYRTGRVLPMEIMRGDQQLRIAWKLPSPTLTEFLARFFNLWLLAYVFWAAGTATSLLLRPKDARWRLFIAFYYLTAAWLITGNISRWRVWESAILMRSLTWLCVPVYLHLHWVFPKSLAKIPRWLLFSGYSLGTALALAEWFRWLPRSSYALGFLLAVAGSAAFLILHFIRQPYHRRVVALMAVAGLLSFVPLIGISLGRLISVIPPFGGIVILGLSVLPLVYFYVVYRRQLGGLELRANRLISFYLFFTLEASVFIVLLPFANRWFTYPGSATFNGVLVSIFAGVVAAIGYPPFKRFVEQRLLSMPLPPDHLLEIFTARITTTLDLSVLTNILKTEVLSSLLVEQTVLFRINDGGQIEHVLVVDVENSQLPAAADIPFLSLHAGKYHPPDFGAGFSLPLLPENLQWIRLILPLKLADRLVGLWLLGRRAPDDFYAQSELPTLQTLANLAAVALTNIAQSAQLRTLYQTEIERYEEERSRLARDLHDDVLNHLSSMGMYVDVNAVDARFSESYHDLIASIRQTVNTLRPPMLHYGLHAALDEMVDELSERAGNTAALELCVPPSELRYDPLVEQNIYRIVQQAIENALRHARASTIRITGELGPASIQLCIGDDGIGFTSSEILDPVRLLSGKHFGLIGMIERSRLIGANVEIRSNPGAGAQVLFTWKSAAKS